VQRVRGSFLRALRGGNGSTASFSTSFSGGVADIPDPLLGATFGHLWEPQSPPQHGMLPSWPRTDCDQPQDQSVPLTCHIQLAGGPTFTL
jgi:hypothetical protein